MAGETVTVGAIADRVYEATELPMALMEEAPKIGMRWRSELIQAIGKRNNQFIIVANLDQVFSASSLINY